MSTMSDRERLKKVWRLMLHRCERPSNPSYAAYGARGIKVCERWHHFENFLSDMGPRPKGYSIDRIDNRGHYEPGNCRWANAVTQSRNKRNNRTVLLNGIAMKLCEAAELTGIGRMTLAQRANAGMPIDQPRRIGRPREGSRP